VDECKLLPAAMSPNAQGLTTRRAPLVFHTYFEPSCLEFSGILGVASNVCQALARGGRSSTVVVAVGAGGGWSAGGAGRERMGAGGAGGGRAGGAGDGEGWGVGRGWARGSGGEQSWQAPPHPRESRPPRRRHSPQSPPLPPPPPAPPPSRPPPRPPRWRPEPKNASSGSPAGGASTPRMLSSHDYDDGHTWPTVVWRRLLGARDRRRRRRRRRGQRRSLRRVTTSWGAGVAWRALYVARCCWCIHKLLWPVGTEAGLRARGVDTWQLCGHFGFIERGQPASTSTVQT